MRYSISLTIAAAVLLAAPASAQDNAVAATNDAVATDPATTDPLATNATDPANGMTADPMAAPLPAEPAATDMNYGEPVDDDDDGRFPWGLLGLLGLAGLIPRKPAERRHDGAI